MKRTRTEQENETRNVGLGLHGSLADTSNGVSGSPIVIVPLRGESNTSPHFQDQDRGACFHAGSSSLARGVDTLLGLIRTVGNQSDRRDHFHLDNAFSSFTRIGFGMSELLTACSKDDPNSVIKGDRQ